MFARKEKLILATPKGVNSETQTLSIEKVALFFNHKCTQLNRQTEISFDMPTVTPSIKQASAFLILSETYSASRVTLGCSCSQPGLSYLLPKMNTHTPSLLFQFKDSTRGEGGCGEWSVTSMYSGSFITSSARLDSQVTATQKANFQRLSRAMGAVQARKLITDQDSCHLLLHYQEFSLSCLNFRENKMQNTVITKPQR